MVKESLVTIFETSLENTAVTSFKAVCAADSITGLPVGVSVTPGAADGVGVCEGLPVGATEGATVGDAKGVGDNATVGVTVGLVVGFITVVGRGVTVGDAEGVGVASTLVTLTVT